MALRAVGAEIRQIAAEHAAPPGLGHAGVHLRGQRRRIAPPPAFPQGAAHHPLAPVAPGRQRLPVYLEHGAVGRQQGAVLGALLEEGAEHGLGGQWVGIVAVLNAHAWGAPAAATAAGPLP